MGATSSSGPTRTGSSNSMVGGASGSVRTPHETGSSSPKPAVENTFSDSFRTPSSRRRQRAVARRPETVRFSAPGASARAISNDDSGISEDPDVRFAVAKKIVERAADFGIPAHDIVVDPLVMPIGAMATAGQQVFALVRRLRKRGIVAGGQLPGYPQHRERMGLAEYVERVEAGELTDPTLTFQLSNGFEVYGLIQGYIEDAYTDDWASLIVWFNPDLIYPDI